MHLILSTAHGRGSGAETILAELFHADVPGFREQLLLAAPVGSHVWCAAQEAGVLSIPWPTRKCTLIQNLCAAARIELPAGIDLVHAWHSRNYEIGLLLGRRLHVPVTTTVHDHPVEVRHRWPRRLLARYCLDHFATAICVSDSLRDGCLKAGVKSPLHIIKNGIRNFSVQRAPSASVRIGFLGMGTPMKGFPLVKGWLSEVSPDVEWHLFGNVCPAFAADIRALEGSVAPRVHYHGTRTVTEIFSQIDILIHASQQFDPYPTVLLEAACAGVPCVASNLGGAPEIVLDGITGFLFDPSNPASGLALLRWLVADPAQRHALGAAARERFMEQFRLEGMARQYMNVWSNTTTHSGSR